MTGCIRRTALLLLMLGTGLLAAAERPALLVVTRDPGNWDRLGWQPIGEEQTRTAFKRDGWEIRRGSYETLAWDNLRQFNVLLLVQPVQSEQIPLLRQFVAAGGGIFYMQGSHQGAGESARTATEFFQPYGLTVLHEAFYEGSPVRTFRNPQSHVHPDFALLADPLPSPVSAGVDHVWVPFCLMDSLGSCWTTTIAADPSWTVVLRGSPTAYSVPQAATYDEARAGQPPADATYKSAPPLMAVAEKDGGRLAVFPMKSTPAFYAGYHWFFEGRFMEFGNGETASDGLTLLRNTCRWLAEPSLGKGKLGGFVDQSETPAAKKAFAAWKKERMSTEPGLIEYDWDTVEFLPKPSVCLRGVVGAHTALSNGTGDVAAHAAAAKAAGYDFVAFTEYLPELDAAEWDRLIEQCTAVTNETFAAVPGIECQDQAGNWYVVFSERLKYPKKEHWATDGTPRVRTIYTFAATGDPTWPAITPFKLHQNPKLPPYLTALRGLGIYTYEHGKLVDDSLDLYWDVQERGYGLFPLVVHLTYSPAETAAAVKAKWQFRVLPKLQDYGRPPILSTRVDDVVRGMYDTSSFPVGRPGSISSGPVVENFQMINPGTTDLSLPGNDRERLRLDVHADTGLATVELLDGRRTIRCWRPTGKDFGKTLDLFHDRQRAYMIRVTDTAGGQCLTQEIRTTVQGHLFCMCGDNQNVMETSDCYGGPDILGRPPEGMETYLPNRGVTTTANFSGVLDGKVTPLSAGLIPARDYDAPLASEFVVIKNHRVDFGYPRSDPFAVQGLSGKSSAPYVEQPNIRWNFREYAYTCKVGGPEISRFELTATLKKDVVAPDGEFLQLYRSTGQGLLVHCDANGSPIVRLATVKGQVTAGVGRLRYGDYIFDAGTTEPTVPIGFMSLQKDDGWPLYYRYRVDEFGKLAWIPYSVCPTPGKLLPAGTQITWNFLTVRDPRTVRPTNETYEAIRHGLGVGGGIGYDCRPTVGEILDTEYELTVRARASGFAAHFLEAPDLPMDLPLVVHGLNPNWSAGIWYKGQNVIHYMTTDYFGTNEVYRFGRTETDTIRRIGILDRTGYCVLDIETGDRDVFVGNLLTCDNPEIVLTLTWAKPDRKEFVVHNPTAGDVEVTVKPAPGFTLLGNFARKVAVPAGNDVVVKL